MTFRDNGIVLKNTPYMNTSLVTMVYTEKEGVLSFLAKGAKRQKSPLRGKLEPGFLISFVYHRGPSTTLGIIKEVEPLMTFSEIRSNLELLNTLYSILWVIEHSPPEKKIFELAVNILQKINKEKRIEFVVYFLLKFYHIEGIFPDLKKCSICGSRDIAFFTTHGGGTLCNRHRDNWSYTINEWFKILVITVRGNIVPIKPETQEEYKKLMNVIIEYGEFHLGDWFHRLREMLPSSITP